MVSSTLVFAFSITIVSYSNAVDIVFLTVLMSDPLTPQSRLRTERDDRPTDATAPIIPKAIVHSRIASSDVDAFVIAYSKQSVPTR